MLERLSDVAGEAGLETLAADVLAGNAAMLGLLRTLGLPRRTETDGDTVTVLVDVSRAGVPAERREWARRHLAAAAASVPPA